MQHLGGGGENQVAALAGEHAAEHEQIAHVVEIGVGGDVVAEVDADGLVDLAGALVAGGHEFLHLLELDGERHLGGKIDAGGREQAADGLLREVLRADAGVAGPFVDGRVFAVIHGDEGEFVEPGW